MVAEGFHVSLQYPRQGLSIKHMHRFRLHKPGRENMICKMCLIHDTFYHPIINTYHWFNLGVKLGSKPRP